MPDFCVGFAANGTGNDFMFTEKGKVFCPDTNTACFVMWKQIQDAVNGTKRKILISGCEALPKDEIKNLCPNQNRCVEVQPNPTEIQHNFRRCCCTGDMCNAVDNIVQFYNYSTSKPTGVEPSDLPTNKFITTTYTAFPKKDEPNSTTAIIIVVCIMLVAVILLLGMVLIRQYKLRSRKLKHKCHTKPTTEEPNNSVKGTAPDLLNEVELGKLIVQDQHSKTWMGSFDDKSVAVRIFKDEYKQFWENEKDILVSSLSHANILKYLAVGERMTADGPEYHILSEYHPQGSLRTYLEHNTVMWRDMCSLQHSIAAGLAYLHDPEKKDGYVHRDISSKNILMKDKNTCVLAGFELAKKVSGARSLTGDEVAKLCTDVGTLRYLAPEVLDGHILVTDLSNSLIQIDMYAMALVLWEIATRCVFEDSEETVWEYKLPFEKELGFIDCKKLFTFILKEKKRPSFPDNWLNTDLPWVKKVKESIEECWDEDPESRLTAYCVKDRIGQLLRHPGPESRAADVISQQCDTAVDYLPSSSSLPTLVSQCKSSFEVKKSKFVGSTV